MTWIYFFFPGTGFGTLDYDWRSVSDTYVKLGTAAALLFGLAAYIPAPAEPLIPIDLSAVALSNKNSQEPIENIDEKSSIYQVYQENAPNRVDRIDKLADNTLFKRFDLLAPFRRKRPSKRPNPFNKRPGKPPQLLKPVTNTNKKRQTAKKTATKPVVSQKNPVDGEIKLEPVKIDNDGDIEKSPFLSDTEFKDFFPSWSEKRKKRATVVTEGRIFNITSFGGRDCPLESELMVFC